MEAYQALESRFGVMNGYNPDQSVACSSGTAALHLAIEMFNTYELCRSPHVIVPDFTMVACARAVTLAGMQPTFVGCNDKLLMDLDLLDKALSEREYAALMIVHVYGRWVDMQQVHELASKYGVLVIEDLAEAHGIPPHPNSFASCWSFYKNKIIHGEEGGMVCFRDTHHANYARSLRSLGFTDAHDFIHIPRGHNYRMSNLHATPILWNMQAFKQNMRSRRECERWCSEECPQEWHTGYGRNAPWVYDFRIPGMYKVHQDEVVRTVQLEDVPIRHGFAPMHCQPEYMDCHTIGGDRTARLSQQTLYLPLSPEIGREEVIRSFSVIRRTVEHVMNVHQCTMYTT